MDCQVCRSLAKPGSCASSLPRVHLDSGRRWLGDDGHSGPIPACGGGAASAPLIAERDAEVTCGRCRRVLDKGAAK